MLSHEPSYTTRLSAGVLHRLVKAGKHVLDTFPTCLDVEKPVPCFTDVKIISSGRNGPLDRVPLRFPLSDDTDFSYGFSILAFVWPKFPSLCLLFDMGDPTLAAVYSPGIMSLVPTMPCHLCHRKNALTQPSSAETGSVEPHEATAPLSSIPKELALSDCDVELEYMKSNTSSGCWTRFLPQINPVPY